MLENDTPPGTKVRFIRAVHKASSGDTATLIGPILKYETDLPEDEFVVEFQGERIIVWRQDIQKAPATEQ